MKKSKSAMVRWGCHIAVTCLALACSDATGGGDISGPWLVTTTVFEGDRTLEMDFTFAHSGSVLVGQLDAVCERHRSFPTACNQPFVPVPAPISQGAVRGDSVFFTLPSEAFVFRGVVRGNQMTGTATQPGYGTVAWEGARR